MNIIDLATKTLQLAIQTAVSGVKTVVDTIKSVVDGIKTKVDSIDVNVDDVNVNVNSVKTNVGSNSDTSSATGSVHAKLKDIKSVATTINTNVNTLINGRTVKSVQRGRATISSGTGTQTITLSTVNTAKCLFDFSLARPQSYTPTITLNSTNITVTKDQSIEWLIDWQIIEFY